MATVIEEIDWDAFVEHGSSYSRFDMASPFVVGGRKYATSRIVAVSMPSPDAASAGRTLPNMDRIFSKWPSFNSWCAWPDVPHCDKCASRGHLLMTEAPCTECEGGCFVKCDNCNGKGYDHCDMGHEHDCDDCDGDGKWKCESCNGSGVQRDVVMACECSKRDAIVGGMVLAESTADAISRLPDPVLFQIVGELVFFKFGIDGRGVAMSKSRD